MEENRKGIIEISLGFGESDGFTRTPFKVMPDGAIETLHMCRLAGFFADGMVVG